MKLLFDCDGTILDSMHIWNEPTHHIFDKYGFDLESLSKEEKGEIEALSYDDMCSYIAENIATEMNKEEVKKYFDDIIVDGYKASLLPKEGALEVLEKLHESGFEMAIASSTDSMYLKLAFERLNIAQFFSFYNTPDLTASKKNEADFWQIAIDNFKVDPSEIILFDDALYAIKAAGNLDIKTCGIKDFPYNEKEWEDIKETADFYLDGIADINIEDFK